MTGSGSRGIGPLLLLLSGPLIWFVHFSLLYGVAGFAEALAIGKEGVRFVAWGATAIAGAAILTVLRYTRRSRRQRSRESIRAINDMTSTLAALSLWAVGLEAAVLWIVPW